MQKFTFLLAYIEKKQYFCSGIAKVMTKGEENRAMYRRWIYMAVALVAAVVLLHQAPCSFLDDKGIIYVRSFSMTQEVFTVIQTNLQTNIGNETTTMSVIGLHYCIKAMIYGIILCFLCWFSDRWRVAIAVLTAIIAGCYYVILVYYISKIADQYYATVYPNIVAILPAIVCQMMLLVRSNIINEVTADTEE